MSLDFSELIDLEQRIASASGPRYRSQTALKLDVMRAVRNQQQRRIKEGIPFIALSQKPSRAKNSGV